MTLKKNWKKSNLDDFDESSHVYFNNETQQAIVDFIRTKSIAEKNRIYSKYIFSVFSELTKIMIHKYKFYYTGDDYESLITETEVHLYDKLNECDWNPNTGYTRFDPDRGKAYSYFSRVAKNFLIQKQRKHQRIVQKYGLDSIDADENYYKETFYEEEPEYEAQDFLSYFIKWLKFNNNNLFEDSNEKIISNCILKFMEDDRVEINNKKMLFFMIKEQTHEKNYKINKVIKKLKEEYYVLKKIYLQEYYIEEDEIT